MTTVFVAKLPRTVDESQLFHFFSNHVDVASAKVVRDADGQSKGYAFVQLLHPEDLDRALELDGATIFSRCIAVEKARI
jgi:RNA recognition motif-containing protein